MFMTGADIEAHLYLERASVICEKVLGEGHPDTASSLNNLAVLPNNLAGLLSEPGFYQGARPLCERALASTRRS